MKEKSWEKMGEIKHRLRKGLTKLTKLEILYARIKKDMIQDLADLDEIMDNEDLAPKEPLKKEG